MPSVDSVTKFLRVLTCATVVVIAGAGARTAGATTLDPSHPVWDGPHARQWARALDAWRAERPDVPRWTEDLTAGLGRRAAVGRRVLVVPVLPADAGSPPVSRAELERRWFGPGEGTLRGYWNHVSAGALDLEGRVLPWLEIPGTLRDDYFNVNDGRPANGAAGSRAMASDALAAAARAVADLRVFDDDGPDGIAGSGDDDGVLDLVVVLHPFVAWEVDPVLTGRGVLSLQSRLSRAPIPGTPLRADAYVVTSATAPLGVWAHEFGHLLGLEDLYDHSEDLVADVGGPDQRLGGLGRWSLMASGTWGGDGALPSGLDAWSRLRLGFGEVVVVDDARTRTLPPIEASTAQTIELRPAGEWDFERFVLENRRRRDGAVVDADLPGSGVLVYRVDDRPGDLGAPNPYLELLQADGRDDLANDVNDGDADDPFTGAPGADRLDGNGLPSTASYAPSPRRPAPVITIDPADADGAHPLRFALFDGPWLQLREAVFGGTGDEIRTDLAAGQSRGWELAFASVGESPVGAASVAVEVLGTGRPATIEPSVDLALSPSGGRWRTTDAIVVSDSSDVADRRPIDVRLTLRIDGRPERILEFGIPVQAAPGVEGAVAMSSFVPQVLAAPGDTTHFVALGITELPRTTGAGWGLRTDGVPRYSDGVEVALTSPWLGLDRRRELEFWTRQDVERSLPGRAWDAGVVEVRGPDGGWRVLEPNARDVVEVWHRSRAAVRARVGLGGDAWTWEPASVVLPDDAVPLQVRFRFGADGDGNARGWEIAGAGTLDPLPVAILEVRPRAAGGLEVVTRFDGDVSAIDQVRYRYRVPGAAEWNAATGPISVRSSETTVNPIDVPGNLDVFEVGLFSELGSGGSGGSTPPLLLGRTGFRRSPEVALPRVLTNPAVSRLVLEVPVRDEEVALRIIDLRGRVVARLAIPAGVSIFEWNGQGGGGARPGSGKYFLTLGDEAERAVPFVWLD